MIYFFASIIIIIINVIPAFMPPTWTIISVIKIRWDVNLMALAIIGAISSSCGRFFLARGSHFLAPKVFQKNVVGNLRFVGKKLNGGKVKMFLVAFIWALLPIGSNPLFIAVGLSSKKIWAVLLGFFIGRVISYFSLAYAADIVYQNIREAFVTGFFDWKKVLLNVIGATLIYLYIAVDWQELFTNKRIRFNLWIFRTNKTNNLV